MSSDTPSGSTLDVSADESLVMQTDMMLLLSIGSFSMLGLLAVLAVCSLVLLAGAYLPVNPLWAVAVDVVVLIGYALISLGTPSGTTAWRYCTERVREASGDRTHINK